MSLPHATETLWNVNNFWFQMWGNLNGMYPLIGIANIVVTFTYKQASDPVTAQFRKGGLTDNQRLVVL